MTNKADPSLLAMEWAWRCEHYGENHLIEGIYGIHEDYQEFGLEYPASLLAEYIFYFGYSGVVLVSALERMKLAWDCLFVWGFHDGDIGYLARCSANKLTRLAIFEEGELP